MRSAITRGQREQLAQALKIASDSGIIQYHGWGLIKPPEGRLGYTEIPIEMCALAAIAWAFDAEALNYTISCAQSMDDIFEETYSILDNALGVHFSLLYCGRLSGLRVDRWFWSQNDDHEYSFDDIRQHLLTNDEYWR